MNKFNFISILIFSSVLAGCSLAPWRDIPQSNLPLFYDRNQSVQIEIPLSKQWWRDFNDESLNLIVEEALQKNDDLALAINRVEQSRASWITAMSSQFPSLNLQGSGTRAKSSDNSYPQGEKQASNAFALSAVLNYEIDLWGRVRNTSRMARANLLASQASRDSVRLSLIASAIEAYYGVIALNRQVALSQETLKAQEEDYSYRKKEFEVGSGTEIAMQQSLAQVASIRAQLQALQIQLNSAQTSLMVLLGRDPKEIFEANVTKSLQMANIPNIPAQIPSKLLERRPDIEIATQNLKAANFSIGVARAAYFPQISLTGLLGLASDPLGDLFKGDSTTWNFGGSALMPLIDAGKTYANIRLANAQYEEMLITYGKTVRTAFGEVRDGLFRKEYSKERSKSLDEQVNALKRTLQIAELRYQEGYTNYLEVLDSRRSLFSAQLSQESALLEGVSATVELYKAFGGGWSKEDWKNNPDDSTE